MSGYDVIAGFYDLLNSDVDYEGAADYYQAQFKKFGFDPKIVLDLGCGTGKLTKIMRYRGYDMIGTDNSVSMLDKAYERCAGSDGILLLLQDFTQLDLYGTVDAAYCCLDGLNSLTKESLFECFKKVSLFTVPGGLFVFDVNSPYKFKNIFADNVYVYDTEEVYLVWQNEYDTASGKCDFELTYFVPDGSGYERNDETITEYCHTPADIEQALEKCGFELLEISGGFSGEKVEKESQRLIFTARKRI